MLLGVINFLNYIVVGGMIALVIFAAVEDITLFFSDERKGL